MFSAFVPAVCPCAISSEKQSSPPVAVKNGISGNVLLRWFYVETALQLSSGKKLTDGESGCFIRDICIWSRITALGRPGVDTNVRSAGRKAFSDGNCRRKPPVGATAGWTKHRIQLVLKPVMRTVTADILHFPQNIIRFEWCIGRKG